jgi:FG-GAP repeat
MSRGLLAAVVMLSATSALAQAPRDAPRDGYHFHDERAVGPFTVQRWVNEASPGVSAAGICDCFTVVYQGDWRVVTLGTAGTLAAYTITDSSGSDLNGDGYPDLVVSAWSGGAHCCYSSGVYSVGENVQQILSLETGNCGPGEFDDLDGNGTAEFITCDDRWAYTYCSFADSPLPRVIYAYEPSRRAFVPDTPRYAIHYRDQLAAALEEAQTWLSESGGRDPGIDKCRLLRPALGLMYSGRFDDGLVLIRSLYHGADREQFERETAEKVRTSPMWAGK